MKKILLIALLLIMNVNALEIRSPEDKVYDTTHILLDVEHDEALDNITFSIDGSNFAVLCNDCVSDTAQLELSEGNHTIDVKGALDNTTYEETVSFIIELPVEEPEIDFSLQIITPEDKTYGTKEIDLDIEANQTLDSIDYEVDGSLYSGCENCTDFDTELNLSEGEHTVKAIGKLGDNTVEDSVTFDIEVVNFTIEIITPEDTTYDTKEIDLDIEADETLDSIDYEVDDVLHAGCEDCSDFDIELNLSEGSHTVKAIGNLNDKTVEDSVTFDIGIPGYGFDLDIGKPTSGKYEKEVEIIVIVNKIVDEIHVEFEGYEKSCDDCSVFEDTVTLTRGNYTMTATGKLNNLTDSETVKFEVVDPDEPDDTDDTEDSNDGSPKFTLGFEKLPKAVEAGEIDDDDLADIIRSNKLNPGVLNRLIKSGKLGEESIDAILDSQFQPKGIFRKLLEFIGFKQPSYAEMIYEEYDLPVKLKQKLVVRPDLPDDYGQKVKEQLKEQVQVKKIEKEQKSFKIGKQLPPGQAKKIQVVNQTNIQENQVEKPKTAGKSGKIPPGQAKR